MISILYKYNSVYDYSLWNLNKRKKLYKNNSVYDYFLRNVNKRKKKLFID